METQLATPCHVLNAEQVSVRRQQSLHVTLSNNDIERLVNDRRQDYGTESVRFVGVVYKRASSAFRPGDAQWCIDGLLNIWPVKVRWINTVQLIGRFRALVSDVLGVEAVIGYLDFPVRLESIVFQTITWFSVRKLRWYIFRWGKRKVLFHIVRGTAAALGEIADSLAFWIRQLE